VDDARCVQPYHDRVREAVMKRTEEGGRSAMLHAQLGRALLSATTEAALPSRVFSIVQHMNMGRAHIDSPDEEKRLAELNLLASQQALLATAFERTRQYAEMGLACLGHPRDEAGAWSREPKLCRELHLALLLGEYRTGQRERALRTFAAAKRHVRDPVERADLFVTLIDLEGSYIFLADAIEAGREILRDLGMPLPKRTTLAHVLAQYARTRRSQRRRPVEELRHLPRLVDPRTKSALRILVALGPAVYTRGDLLFPWVMMRIAQVSMEHGLSESSPVGFASYGVVLGAFGRHQEAAAFGELAVALADRDKCSSIRATAHFIHANLVAPWARGTARTLEGLEEALRLARSCGDTDYAIYSMVSIPQFEWTIGRDVKLMESWGVRGGEFATLCKAEARGEAADVYLRYALALRGRTPSLLDLSLPGSTQADFIASLRNEMAVGLMYIALAELAYFAGDARRAETHILQAHRRRDRLLGFTTTADIWFLHALIAARRCEGASAVGRLERLIQVHRATRKLEAWGRSAPENFEPFALIARAELLRIQGRRARATAAYATAIAVAERCVAPRREAIASELASQHARTTGDAAAARRYHERAVDAYRRWGATAVADALAARGP
jgi:tetratricopeptide (TPR) repeat protein